VRNSVFFSVALLNTASTQSSQREKVAGGYQPTRLGGSNKSAQLIIAKGEAKGFPPIIERSNQSEPKKNWDIKGRRGTVLPSGALWKRIKLLTNSFWVLISRGESVPGKKKGKKSGLGLMTKERVGRLKPSPSVGKGSRICPLAVDKPWGIVPNEGIWKHRKSRSTFKTR